MFEPDTGGDGVTISQTEAVRHAEERGKILAVLREAYDQEMVTVTALLGTLDLGLCPVSPEGMQFHLRYLADSQYIRILRVRDLPSYRADRAGSQRPDQIVFAKLLPRGLHLLDGLIPADPSVRF